MGKDSYLPQEAKNSCQMPNGAPRLKKGADRFGKRGAPIGEKERPFFKTGRFIFENDKDRLYLNTIYKKYVPNKLINFTVHRNNESPYN